MLRPLGKNIIVKRLADDTKTPGGLFIPDNAKTTSLKAEVVAIGPDVDDKIKCLDTRCQIILGKYSGMDVQDGDETYLIVLDEDVKAVVA